MLKIEHLNKNFGSLKVLGDLDLEVKDASIFGLVGVNGAGKSTLLRCISGVYEPDGGVITLDGQNTCTQPEVRSQIAYVSDELYFPVASTIQSQKRFYEKLYPSFSQALFQQYLFLFELNEKMAMNNLSKGNRRRAALVFALSLQPRLLLLDEAYDGLEPLARFRFKNILTNLMEDQGLSVIISSHNLKELEDICDSFGILEQGRITSYGDLIEEKEDLNRYQVAFADEKNESDFAGFDVLHYEKEGRVIQMVIRGRQEQVEAKLRAMDPLLLDVMPCSFEELFIYEVEEQREGKHE